MMVRLLWYSDPLYSPHQLKKKTVVKVGPHLTKLSGSAHEFSSLIALLKNKGCGEPAQFAQTRPSLSCYHKQRMKTLNKTSTPGSLLCIWDKYDKRMCWPS